MRTLKPMAAALLAAAVAGLACVGAAVNAAPFPVFAACAVAAVAALAFAVAWPLWREVEESARRSALTPEERAEEDAEAAREIERMLWPGVRRDA